MPYLALEIPGLESREADADFEIQLLPGINGHGLVLVGKGQGRHCRPNRSLRDGRELGSQDWKLNSLGSHPRLAVLYDLEADVLAFPVAVQPQQKEVSAFGLPPEV